MAAHLSQASPSWEEQSSRLVQAVAVRRNPCGIYANGLSPAHPTTPNHTDQKQHGIPEETPTPEEGLWPRKGWAGRAH